MHNPISDSHLNRNAKQNRIEIWRTYTHTCHQNTSRSTESVASRLISLSHTMQNTCFTQRGAIKTNLGVMANNK
jgi:hypothetical protein